MDIEQIRQALFVIQAVCKSYPSPACDSCPLYADHVCKITGQSPGSCKRPGTWRIVSNIKLFETD